MDIKAVLFDVDGALIDSNDQHVSAWAEAFSHFGLSLTPQTIHAQIGQGSDLLVSALWPEAPPETVEALRERHDEIFRSKHRAYVRPFPKAHDLLLKICNSGREVVIASSTSKKDLDDYTDLLGAHHLLRAAISLDDVKTSKPAPDIFINALRTIGLDAGQALAIGDSPYDMAAAGRSGIAAIAVRSGKFCDEALRTAGAAALYDDASALLDAFERWICGVRAPDL